MRMNLKSMMQQAGGRGVRLQRQWQRWLDYFLFRNAAQLGVLPVGVSIATDKCVTMVK